MKTQTLLLAAVAAACLLLSCKKKDNNDPNPAPTGTTTGTPAPAEYSFSQSVGGLGSSLNEFDFNTGGSEMAWTMTTDGTFIYVGDLNNHCIKKVDLSTNTVVGWYGFSGGAWGFYTTGTPQARITPFRLLYSNNNLYAFSHKGVTGKTAIYKFSLTGSTIDSSRVIPEYNFFTVAIDNSENIYLVQQDSVKKYATTGTVTRFGGSGSTDGKLNIGNSLAQPVMVGDTLVTLDPGNGRVQKFSSSGAFISKFTANIAHDYRCLYYTNNKYYFLEGGSMAEYSQGGTRLATYNIKNNPSGFSAGQKQFIIIGNKVIFQDMFSYKLHVYTK